MAAKETVEKLLDVAEAEEQVELKILYNASVENLKGYQDKPTASRKKDLDAARAALAEVLDRLWEKYFPAEKKFDNLLAVVKHLQGQGYKIKKSKIYNDRQKKFIRVQPDGTVFKKDADKYAKTLTMLGDPLSGVEEIQKRKIELEANRLEKQNALLQFDLDLKENRYISKAEADMAKAANITVIEANVRNMHLTGAGAWIELVNGDSRKTSDLINAMGQKLDELFNKLISMDQFRVVFVEGADESTSQSA